VKITNTEETNELLESNAYCNVSYFSSTCYHLLHFLERRKELTIDSYNQQLALTNTEDLKLIFKEVVPGKPLNETVWDNVTGAFWDVKESVVF